MAQSQITPSIAADTTVQDSGTARSKSAKALRGKTQQAAAAKGVVASQSIEVVNKAKQAELLAKKVSDQDEPEVQADASTRESLDARANLAAMDASAASAPPILLAQAGSNTSQNDSSNSSAVASVDPVDAAAAAGALSTVQTLLAVGLVAAAASRKGNDDPANLTLTGGAGADSLVGGYGNDTLTGGAGNDTLTGGAGNDTFNIDSGSDTITDLTTGDIVKVSAGASGTANNVSAFVATSGTTNAGSMTINAAATASNINLAAAGGPNGYTVNGGAGNDTLTGSGFNDTIAGGAGNDVITGGAGNDALSGGAGNDTFNVDSGSDNITDLATGDSVKVSSGATATASPVTAFVATAGTTNAGTMIINADPTAASTIDLTLAGGPNGYTVNGGAGNDSLTGSAFNDTIVAGAGNDTITSGAGNDSLTGGAGNDTFNVDAGNDTITDLTTGDIVKVSAGATAIANMSASSFVAAAGTTNAGGMTINATAAASSIDLTAAGGPNGYTVNGSAFNDTIVGSAFNDTIVAGAGDDTITSGAGNDTLTGGAGNDTFNIDAGSDTITDLATGDVLNVSAGATVNASIAAGSPSAFVATSSTIATGTVNLQAAASGSTIDLQNAQVSGSGSYNVTGGAGADTIKLSGADAVRGAIDVNLGDTNDGVTDLIYLNNTTFDSNSKWDGAPALPVIGDTLVPPKYADIFGFDTLDSNLTDNVFTGDRLVIGNTPGGGLVPSGYQPGTYCNDVRPGLDDFSAFAPGSIIEIYAGAAGDAGWAMSSGFTNWNSLASMLSTINGVKNGEYWLVVYDGTSNSANAAIYQVRTSNWDDPNYAQTGGYFGFQFNMADNLATTYVEKPAAIELLTVLHGVGANSFGADNFIV